MSDKLSEKENPEIEMAEVKLLEEDKQTEEKQPNFGEESDEDLEEELIPESAEEKKKVLKILKEHEKKFHSTPNPTKTFEKIDISHRSLANPGPLGLLCFGLTTTLLNFHNAGLYPFDTMVIATGLIFGGFVQMIAGFLEYKKNNTFGVVAFLSYGAFWVILILIKVSGDVFPIYNSKYAATATSMGYFLSMWGLFTLFMFIGTLKLKGPHVLQIIFALLFFLFLFLVIGEFTGQAWVTVLAGVDGIATGLSAVYLAVAEVINENWGRTILPVQVALFDLPKLLKLGDKVLAELSNKNKKKHKDDDDDDDDE